MKVQMNSTGSFTVLEDSENLTVGMSVPVAPGNSQYNTIREFAAANGLIDENGDFVPDDIGILSAPVPAIADLRTQAKAEVDAYANQIRDTYQTPGMGGTYIAKSLQMDAYAAAGYPADLTAYGYISAEIARLGLDPAIQADRVAATDGMIAIRDQWIAVDGMIETARLSGKADIDKRTTEATVAAAKDTAIAELDALRNPVA